MYELSKNGYLIKPKKLIPQTSQVIYDKPIDNDFSIFDKSLPKTTIKVLPTINEPLIKSNFSTPKIVGSDKNGNIVLGVPKTSDITKLINPNIKPIGKVNESYDIGTFSGIQTIKPDVAFQVIPDKTINPKFDIFNADIVTEPKTEKQAIIETNKILKDSYKKSNILLYISAIGLLVLIYNTWK